MPVETPVIRMFEERGLCFSFSMDGTVPIMDLSVNNIFDHSVHHGKHAPCLGPDTGPQRRRAACFGVVWCACNRSRAPARVSRTAAGSRHTWQTTAAPCATAVIERAR